MRPCPPVSRAPACCFPRSPLDSRGGRRRICLETKPRMKPMAAVNRRHSPLSHPVPKRKPSADTAFFSSNDENQAEVISTKNKKHTNARPFRWWTGPCNQMRINFLSVVMNELLLPCALCSRIYCTEQSARKPSKIAQGSVTKWLERRNRDILRMIC